MNNTFFRVASLCGLRLSYYITAGLLTLTFLVLVPTNYRTASPLYILLMLAVLPSLMKALFFDKQTNTKNEVLSDYPLFCQKYRYNTVQYKSMNIAYPLIFILLAAWHISYFSLPDRQSFIMLIPSLIAGFSLLIRILGTLGYRLYFYLFPLKAMR